MQQHLSPQLQIAMTDEANGTHLGPEAHLLEAHKMACIGRLAGGIAHDLNNLLTVIKGYSEMLLSETGMQNSFVQSGLQEIKEAGHCASSLTQQLLAISRRQAMEPKVIDLNEAVTNTARLLRRVIGENIVLVVCPESRLGAIRADPGHVSQIIMNLVINARDAMAGGGQLTVETMNVEITSASTDTVEFSQPGSYAVLSVSDTGCGMTEETLARIFEPFFTTKETGTGLGLATVERIMKQLGGGICVSSQIGKGTTFTLYFPCSHKELKRELP